MKSHKFLFAAALLTTATCAHALTGTWTLSGNASGSWETGSNWSGGTPGATDDIATFNQNITATSTITLDGTRNVGTLNFTDATTASNDWVLSAGTGGSLVLNSSTTTATISVTNRTATISANISAADNEGLTKTGTGTLTLTGTSTYTGITTVSAGTLNIQASQNYSGNWTIGTGTTATTNVGTGSGSEIINSSGTLNISKGGALNINNGANWNQSGGLTIYPTSNTGFGSTLKVNTGGTFTYTGTTDIAFRAADGNTGTATLNLAGGTFVTGKGFSNAGNTTTGTGANITFSNGGTIKLSANIASLCTSTGTPGYPINITLGTGGGVIDTNGFSTTFDKIASDVSGQSGSLTKKGAGSLTLTGANAYTGGTIIKAGTLVTGNASALGGGNVSLDGGTLQVGNGSNQLILGSAKNVSTTDATASVLKFTANLGADTGSGALANITLSGGGKYDFSLGSITLDLNNQFDAAGTYHLIAGGTGNVDASSYSFLNFDNSNWSAAFSNGDLVVTAVPEPSTYGLIGAGVLAAVSMVRRRRKHNGEVA